MSAPIRFPVEDGSSYALPSPDRDGIEEALGWRLLYGHIDQTDRNLLASILRSYESLLFNTDKKSRLVRRAFREQLLRTEGEAA